MSVFSEHIRSFWMEVAVGLAFKATRCSAAVILIDGSGSLAVPRQARSLRRTSLLNFLRPLLGMPFPATQFGPNGETLDALPSRR